MKIAFVSSEAYPYAVASEIACFSGNLPQALSKYHNVDIKVFIPRYRIVDKNKYNLKLKSDIFVPSNEGKKKASIYSCEMNGVEYIFIEYNLYFDRKQIYGNIGNDYPDNLERFSFFSRAVLEAIKELDFYPDIIHCNDWQTALVPVYIDQFYLSDNRFRKIKRIFTVHNLAYQGLFDASKWNSTCLIDRSLFVPDKLEFWGKINLLKGGLLYSHIILL